MDDDALLHRVATVPGFRGDRAVVGRSIGIEVEVEWAAEAAQRKQVSQPRPNSWVEGINRLDVPNYSRWKLTATRADSA